MLREFDNRENHSNFILAFNVNLHRRYHDRYFILVCDFITNTSFHSLQHNIHLKKNYIINCYLNLSLSYIKFFYKLCLSSCRMLYRYKYLHHYLTQRNNVMLFVPWFFIPHTPLSCTGFQWQGRIVFVTLEIHDICNINTFCVFKNDI